MVIRFENEVWLGWSCLYFENDSLVLALLVFLFA